MKDTCTIYPALCFPWHVINSMFQSNRTRIKTEWIFGRHNLSFKSRQSKNPDKVADILVVASFGELLPKEYLSNFDLCVNVHPSALPKWRGANPLQSAILAGDSSAKVTIQTIAEKFDHGQILGQSEEVPISRKVCKMSELFLLFSEILEHFHPGP